MRDGVFSVRKILWPSHRRNCGRLPQRDSLARWNSTRTTNQKKRFHWRYSEWSLHFSHPRECRRLPLMTAWSTPLITMDKTRAGRDTRCPYSKIKLTKLPLNNSLDKFPPPSFYKIWYIFKIYYKYIYKPTHVYVSMCKIHTNSEQASIIRERI